MVILQEKLKKIVTEQRFDVEKQRISGFYWGLEFCMVGRCCRFASLGCQEQLQRARLLPHVFNAICCFYMF